MNFKQKIAAISLLILFPTLFGIFAINTLKRTNKEDEACRKIFNELLDEYGEEHVGSYFDINLKSIEPDERADFICKFMREMGYYTEKDYKTFIHENF